MLFVVITESYFMHNLTLNLNPDMFRWIEANRGELSRAAFVVAQLKIMQDTAALAAFHTKGNHDSNILNGAIDAPKQV